MKRATTIVAGIITFAACTILEIRIPTIQPAERWTDPNTTEWIEILRVRPIHTMTEDRFMLGEAAADPAETREIILQCGPAGWTVRFNPVTHVTYAGNFQPFRSHACASR